MDPVRKLLLGLGIVAIAFGAWTLYTLTGLGAWFAAGVGSAAVFVLAGSNLVGWAFGSRRVDLKADEDFARLGNDPEKRLGEKRPAEDPDDRPTGPPTTRPPPRPKTPPSPAHPASVPKPSRSVLFPDADGR